MVSEALNVEVLPSADFAKDSFATFSERIHRFLKTLRVYISLRDVAKAELCHMNVFNLIVILYGRLEISTTLFEQMSIVCTSAEMVQYSERLDRVRNVKNITMRDFLDALPIKKEYVDEYFLAIKAIEACINTKEKMYLTIIFCILHEFGQLELPKDALKEVAHMKLFFERRLQHAVRGTVNMAVVGCVQTYVVNKVKLVYTMFERACGFHAVVM